MLTKASSRFGSGLSNLQTSSSCTRRCAPTSTALLSQPRLQGTNPRPNRSTLKHHLLSPTPRSSTSQLLRCASTSAASPQAPSTTSPATTTTTSPQTTTISWNDYLALRKTRRRYNLIASIFTSLGTTSLGVTVLSRQNFDQLGGLFGLDPFIVLGLATASSGAVGWLLGPFVGNALFGMVHRKVGRQIAEKEKDFYRRIKRYRVDPSSQSFSNPVPDYYGEKIGSVSEFRNWMKDQRAYNKKRQSFL